MVAWVGGCSKILSLARLLSMGASTLAPSSIKDCRINAQLFVVYMYASQDVSFSIFFSGFRAFFSIYRNTFRGVDCEHTPHKIFGTFG